MQSAVTSPLYDDITDRVATSILDLAPDVWVERHRLLNHVTGRMVKEIRGLGIVPAQSSTGPEERAIEERVVDDALEKLQQRVGWETRTIDGAVCYRFGPSTSRAPCSTPALPEAAGEPVESPTSSEKVVPVSVPEDETTETTCRPAADIAEGEPEYRPVKSPGASNLQEVGTIILIRVEDLRPHPALEKIPEMLPREWAEFLKDVRTRGVVEPVTVQKGNIMLDGRHRRRGARESSQEFVPGRLVDWTPDEQIDYIYRAATCRRSLTDDQRALLAAAWAEARASRSRKERARKAGQAGGRSRPKKDEATPKPTSPVTSGTHQPMPPAESLREQAAQQFGVSERKVKASQALGKEHPGLADEVRAGKKTLLQARREARKRNASSGPAVTARPKGLPGKDVAEQGVPNGPAASTATGDAGMALKLAEKSSEALLDALAASFGLEEALRLLRGALHLGEQRRPRPQVRIIPPPPADDDSDVTETEPEPEVMN